MTTTTAKEMKQKRAVGIEFLLKDYDDVVFVKPIDAALWFMTGRVPDWLASTVQTALNGQAYQMPIPTELSTRDWLVWLNSLVKETIVSPKVVDAPQGTDEIGIDELSYNDKLAIYYLFGSPAERLRKFRLEQIKSLASVDAQQDIGPGSKRGVPRPAVGE